MEKKNAIEMHRLWQGKIEVTPRVKVESKDDLSIAYTPGVAEVCLAIEKEPKLSYELTRRNDLVAVITDGTAVLGLGDIGPLAAMPVMEGKALLFKTFANVDAIPLCINTKDTDELVKIISSLQYSFGGINLEDISAPRCFEIERRVQELCDIPIFHDDQHGTAIVVGAALLNATKLTGKKITEVRVVINGAGAAGLSVANFLVDLGVKDLILCGRHGIIQSDDETSNDYQKEFAKTINPRKVRGTLADAIKNADVFIGLSKGNVVSKEMISSMNEKSIVLPLANPVPEISYTDAVDAGAYIVGTGGSVYPNQINNVLAFPGIFRGALNVKAKRITKEMRVAASKAIASSVSEDKLSRDYIIPFAFDKNVHQAVIAAVEKAALK